VWSFGCVLYEMLAGVAPFNGPTASDIIAAILKTELDWNALPADTPRPVERLLKRCLVKDQGMRLRDLGDAQLDIADARSDAPTERSQLVAARPSIGRRLAWPVAAAGLALATFVLTRGTSQRRRNLAN
jgi:serine/threonine protein kinase